MSAYDGAVKMVAAAVSAAEAMSVKVGVVVLDAGGAVIAAGRMDGAYLTATTLAEKKAFTALNFGVPSATMAERVQPIPYQAVVAAADPRLTFIGGGLPVPGGGAVGVSGATAEQDVACAEAALEAIA
jgi:uncharacterized protein GlcG (DUF336 family)